MFFMSPVNKLQHANECTARINLRKRSLVTCKEDYARFPTAFCQEAHFHEDSLHLHSIAFVLSATHFDPFKKKKEINKANLYATWA